MIKRIPRKNKPFTYEDVKFELRQPRVEEVQTITRLLAAYQRSLRNDIVADKADNIIDYSVSQGDITLMIATQKYVCETLVIDPDTGKNVFGAADEQDKIEDVPGDFIQTTWFCYSGQLEREEKVRAEADKAKAAAANPDAVVEVDPPSPLETTAATTTSPSDAT